MVFIKHLVKCIDKSFVRYSDVQDLSAFVQRSDMLNNEMYVNGELQRFCMRKLQRYLGACRNQSELFKLARKLFPSLTEWYLLKTYRLKNLLIILFALRSLIDLLVSHTPLLLRL